MRYLGLLRGAMGAGKSTFIKNQRLEQYTLSPDNIRLMFQTPVLTETGKTAISMNNEKKVWSFLFQLLEERMKRGEFTIIDATHSKQSDFSKYKKLAEKYRYRVFCVDFTDIPMERAKAQNLEREGYKHVPEQTIENLYERFKTQTVPNWVEAIKPEQYKEFIQYKPINLSSWKKIHHIGDIHGCYDVLMDFLLDGLKDDELYIFVGDWVDRGIQNAEVLNFLFTIMDKQNVIFVEGNHEIHIWNWANNNEIRSREFKQNTQIELESKGVDKKLARILYRKVRQLVYYTYGDKKVLVTHAGISTLPDNLMYIATDQFIKGVGKYETPIDEIFTRNTLDKIYQIHGHRNIHRCPVQVTSRTFNLEGQVEMGGCLRVVTLSKDGFECSEYQNKVFHPKFLKREIVSNTKFTDGQQLIRDLRTNNNIVEKSFGNISSFNFSNKVFYDKLWDEQTIKARGLFINTESGEIVARSYNKFFNVNERSFTKINKLADDLRFPVFAYDKPNGFLGILGYDTQTDQLLYCSKSNIGGEYSEYFRKIFEESVDQKKLELIKNYLRDEVVAMTFEVIDIHNDPHIIEYQSNKIVLLDIVHRAIEYKKKPFVEVVAIANNLGIEHKQLVREFDSWGDFYNWYQSVTSEDFQSKIEGFVIEDSKGFMVKIKVGYYKFWKQMRGLKDRLSKQNPKVNLSSLYTVRHNEFYNWCKNQEKNTLAESDIITLRNKFELENKQN